MSDFTVYTIPGSPFRTCGNGRIGGEKGVPCKPRKKKRGVELRLTLTGVAGTRCPKEKRGSWVPDHRR